MLLLEFAGPIFGLLEKFKCQLLNKNLILWNFDLHHMLLKDKMAGTLNGKRLLI